jgi:hypothetical protein
MKSGKKGLDMSKVKAVKCKECGRVKFHRIVGSTKRRTYKLVCMCCEDKRKNGKYAGKDK